ncbi:Splicing factor SF3a60-like [Gracilariopsis chorda]|uniref:Splicing factor SF3a60-like n=1 Tax=Gracilariopsis chorda TaxID=448386 RepID=A0A2V3IJN0_9FLOR|nr:Splicing factor SF3a60-like [Gracilariopsis chorda]|eukprot:PXF42304.1 Splicing factor SF3a60-like [Gracilariopsis chorda]
MSSELENMRQMHEDLETLQHLAAAALQSRVEPSTPHQRLKWIEPALQTARDAEQLAADLCAHASKKAAVLCSQYEQTLPRREDDALSSFYAQLRDLRDLHRSRPALASSSRDAALLQASYKAATFSGEECGGRYLDVLCHYQTYLNVSKQSVEYYQYVRDNISDFCSLAGGVRTSKAYERYLSELEKYLKDFARRAHPLEGTDEHMQRAHEEARKQIEKMLSEIAATYGTDEQLLEQLGGDALRERLVEVGLKCGGRPQERAKRLLKAAREMKYGRIALLERSVRFALDKVLAPERRATVANIQKRLGLSYAEIEAERRAMEAVADGVEEEVEQVESTLYNPKDVPLGWDGKPIPYWMYKLHGLNHEFKCEICGNGTYKGPRAFERHFTDSQHVQGLRRLGIGYSKAYMMITGIEDALKLEARMRLTEAQAQFDEDRDMEFEDAAGNVMNRKTYNDLLRQGLI